MKFKLDGCEFEFDDTKAYYDDCGDVLMVKADHFGEGQHAFHWIFDEEYFEYPNDPCWTPMDNGEDWQENESFYRELPDTTVYHPDGAIYPNGVISFDKDLVKLLFREGYQAMEVKAGTSDVITFFGYEFSKSKWYLSPEKVIFKPIYANEKLDEITFEDLDGDYFRYSSAGLEISDGIKEVEFKIGEKVTKKVQYEIGKLYKFWDSDESVYSVFKYQGLSTNGSDIANGYKYRADDCGWKNIGLVDLEELGGVG